MFDLEILRAELYAHIGLDAVEDTDSLTVEMADRLINRSYAWLLNAFKFRVKEKSVSFPTIIGIRNYDLPTDFEALRDLSLVDASSQHLNIDRMTNDEYEGLYNESSDDYSQPTRYVREGNCIRLFKTPDAVYTMILKYNRLMPDLALTNLEPKVPKNWDEFILQGAVYRGYARLGDLVRAAAIKKSLIEDVRAAQPVEKLEEADSRRAHLEAILPEYEL